MLSQVIIHCALEQISKFENQRLKVFSEKCYNCRKQIPITARPMFCQMSNVKCQCHSSFWAFLHISVFLSMTFQKQCMGTICQGLYPKYIKRQFQAFPKILRCIKRVFSIFTSKDFPAPQEGTGQEGHQHHLNQFKRPQVYRTENCLHRNMRMLIVLRHIHLLLTNISY